MKIEKEVLLETIEDYNKILLEMEYGKLSMAAKPFILTIDYFN